MYAKRGNIVPVSIWTSAIILILASLSFIGMMTTQGVNAQERKHLDVAYYQNSPFIYTNGNGEPSGIVREVLQPIFEDMGYDVKFHRIEQGSWRNEFSETDADILVGCNINRLETEDLSFSNEPLFSNWGVLYSNPEFRVSTILDLKGAWLGTLENDIYYESPEGLGSLLHSFDVEHNIVRFENYNELISTLEKGDIDVGILNSAIGSYIGDSKAIERTSIIFSPVDVGTAVESENNEMLELQEKVDRALSELKSDPDSHYYDVLDKYLTPGNDRPAKEIIPIWLIPFTLILVFSIILLTGIALILRNSVRSKTEELKKTNKRLNRDIIRRQKVEEQLTEERNRSLFYLDLLIHDIGNIHQGLISHIQIYDVMKDDRSRADANVKQMGDLLTRSRGLMTNVKMFTEAVSREKELETMDIAPIIKRSLSSMLLSSPHLDIITDIDLGKAPIEVECEPLIEELFSNLFHNAVKFQNGPTVFVGVQVKMINNGHMYEIRVSDKGNGIPDHMKETIFSRLERSTERKHRGMGLTIVSVLAKRYSGKVTVEDRVPGDHKKGATFVVKLPASRKDPSYG